MFISFIGIGKIEKFINEQRVDMLKERKRGVRVGTERRGSWRRDGARGAGEGCYNATYHIRDVLKSERSAKIISTFLFDTADNVYTLFPFY